MRYAEVPAIERACDVKGFSGRCFGLRAMIVPIRVVISPLAVCENKTFKKHFVHFGEMITHRAAKIDLRKLPSPNFKGSCCLRVSKEGQLFDEFTKIRYAGCVPIEVSMRAVGTTH
jgi:hypothetical protein